MIQDIYTEFPSRILTLETDCANNPYPNRYEYTGSWTGKMVKPVNEGYLRIPSSREARCRDSVYRGRTE